ncbi:hypothetical protein R1flu_021015 [Riccia fluitans]|uniref:Chlorophyll a-b binding protein, chloroplastic n=1 Tax=Riccia fluitans TaxID=41844 RepID=A0ABD1ZNM6_9MARC
MAATILILAVPAGLRSAPLASFSGRSGISSLGYRSLGAPRYTKRGGPIRCEGVRETVDKATKKEITKEEILQNQETNQSEKQSVFGAVPSSGSFYPRPEVERRPETGERNLGSIFAFDGAAPETINGRLAMVGIFWAAIAEKMSGLTVFDQLYTQGTDEK